MNEVKLRLEQHKMWLLDSDKGKRFVASEIANLRSADLRYANLTSANLRSANLRSANLRSANLTYADLTYANLRSANLTYADLRSANLTYADLTYADLTSANLTYADLTSANLTSAKEDFFKRLVRAKNEVKGLYDYLQKGKVDGQSYEGECACFVGTLAKIEKVNYNSLVSGVMPDSNSPTERWFLAILKGDTPQSNAVSKITCEWIEEFCKSEGIVLPLYKIVSSEECPEAFENGGI